MTEKTPLVTIGCPTYNRPDGLRHMLECSIGQTYTNLEIIVSDNCSECEEVEKIVRELMRKDPRIRYIRQPQNIGSFNNYKFLLAEARGEYFAWACDDDSRKPEYIEACIKEFDRLKTPIIVNSFSQRVDRDTDTIIAIDKGCTTIGMPAHQRYIKYISTIYTEQAAVTDINYGVMDRRALVDAMQDVPNIAGWDHVLLARLALDGEFYTIPTVLMESGASGLSANPNNVIKTQQVRESKSATMPVWVRQTYKQRTIWNSPSLNEFEKLYLSIWSYIYYFTTHGLKMWVKGLFPQLYAFFKRDEDLTISHRSPQ
jgi:glycosyltransferase involved in cell wall biosynthesis